MEQSGKDGRPEHGKDGLLGVVHVDGVLLQPVGESGRHRGVDWFEFGLVENGNGWYVTPIDVSVASSMVFNARLCLCWRL
jgi:hypothetical protein